MNYIDEYDLEDDCYECPQCGWTVHEDTIICPNCNIKL